MIRTALENTVVVIGVVASGSVSEHLSTRETTQSVPVIPARPAWQSGEAEIQTRKARTGDVAGSHQQQQAVAKQMMRFEGRSRPIEIGEEEEEIWETEERVREKMGLGRGTELKMMSEGRRVDWEGLAEIQAGRMAEVGLMTRGGGQKRKTKTGNQWGS